MLKYFKGKIVSIVYEYNNSLGTHENICYNCKYDRLEIKEADFGWGKSFCFQLFLQDKVVFELDLPGHTVFEALGRLWHVNDGPYCYLTIKKLGLFGSLLTIPGRITASLQS